MRMLGEVSQLMIVSTVAVALAATAAVGEYPGSTPPAPPSPPAEPDAPVARDVEVPVGSGPSQGRSQPGHFLAYDGFRTGTGAGSYRDRMRLSNSPGAVYGTTGMAKKLTWTGSTPAIQTVGQKTLALTHNLLRQTQPGCLIQLRMRGVFSTRRNLPRNVAWGMKGRVSYAVCVLIQMREQIGTRSNMDTPLGTSSSYGMIGFTPDNTKTTAGPTSGDCGAKGLSLGYRERDLCVFAGGRSFTIVPNYQIGKTYLLMAEMVVAADGPEFIQAYSATAEAKDVTPAKFNDNNGGKGASVETWSGPNDLMELEIYIAQRSEVGRARTSTPPIADGPEFLVSWDEVYLMAQAAAVPVAAPHVTEARETTVAKDPGGSRRRSTGGTTPPSNRQASETNGPRVSKCVKCGYQLRRGRSGLSVGRKGSKCPRCGIRWNYFIRRGNILWLSDTRWMAVPRSP